MKQLLAILQKHALLSYMTASNIVLLVIIVVGFSILHKQQSALLSDAYDNQANVRESVYEVHRDVIQKIELHCEFQEQASTISTFPATDKVPNMICVQDPKKLM